MSFSVKGFFSKCEQIGSFQRICLHLLKKSVTGYLIVVFSGTYLNTEQYEGGDIWGKEDVIGPVGDGLMFYLSETAIYRCSIE